MRALAELNRQLIEDEGHADPGIVSLSVGELAERMRSWLDADYSAVWFERDANVVGYALYRPDEDGIHLRQFFVARSCRRSGVGRGALRALREQAWPAGTRVSVEVLVGNERALAFWRSVGFADYAIGLRG